VTRNERRAAALGRERKFILGVYRPPFHPHIKGMNLELDDEETAVLIKELSHITEDDKYPFSPRIRVLQEILGKLRREPVREPLPPPKQYAPPRATRARRRRG
jgi:hypothetical protein